MLISLHQYSQKTGLDGIQHEKKSFHWINFVSSEDFFTDGGKKNEVTLNIVLKLLFYKKIQYLHFFFCLKRSRTWLKLPCKYVYI